MKKLLFLPGAVLLLAAGALWGTVLAQEQAPQQFQNLRTREQVLQYIEQRAMGDPQTYQETSDLVNKLIAGTLSEQEANRLAELLDQDPGVVTLMVHRMEMSDMGARMRAMMREAEQQGQ